MGRERVHRDQLPRHPLRRVRPGQNYVYVYVYRYVRLAYVRLCMYVSTKLNRRLVPLRPTNRAFTTQVTLTDRSGKQSTYKAILRGFDPDKVSPAVFLKKKWWFCVFVLFVSMDMDVVGGGWMYKRCG